MANFIDIFTGLAPFRSCIDVNLIWAIAVFDDVPSDVLIR